MKKKFLLILCCVILFGGCGKKEDVIPKVEDVKEETIIEEKQEEVIDELAGKAVNPLTGLYIDEEVAARRPITVVINNLHKALPQSGIGEADIIYEALAEGEITRMVAVFQEFYSDKIGPVRSARDYFTYFALDNNAVFIHHGGSPTGYAAIKKRNINDIDGMNDESCFWRDKDRVNKPGMYEHSSYTSAERILESCERKGFDMKYDSEKTPMFSFNFDEVINEVGENTSNITIPYSGYQISQFKYSSEKMIYERYQSDMPHIDEITGNTLEFKNVIIQFARTAVIDNDGRRDMELVGTGQGVYISNGKRQNIKWSKENFSSPTKWMTDDENELRINKGKTFICVCPEGMVISYE